MPLPLADPPSWQDHRCFKGQKSQQRKWICCFESVTALIYLASLGERDHCLEANSKEVRSSQAVPGSAGEGTCRVLQAGG